MMRISTPSLAAALLFATATPAFAQDTAPPPAVTVTGGATVVTDYRFRGISQTDKDFAIQGTFTVAHESGFYATVWASSIDDYISAGGDTEIDLIGGYKKTVGGTTFDVGVLYYYYPGSEKIIPGYNSDFFEPYVSVSHTVGPVTGKLSAAYAPKQSALVLSAGREDNLYTAVDLSGGLPTTPISLSAHLGHTFGPSYLSNGFKNYTDWSLGASYTWNHLTFGVSYVDTNKSAFSPSGKNTMKAGVVGSVGVSF